jgi:hypothetical protein
MDEPLEEEPKVWPEEMLFPSNKEEFAKGFLKGTVSACITNLIIFYVLSCFHPIFGLCLAFVAVIFVAAIYCYVKLLGNITESEEDQTQL